MYLHLLTFYILIMKPLLGILSVIFSVFLGVVLPVIAHENASAGYIVTAVFVMTALFTIWKVYPIAFLCSASAIGLVFACYFNVYAEESDELAHFSGDLAYLNYVYASTILLTFVLPVFVPKIIKDWKF